jgi:phosphatidylserine/phosphatidylglycerophosphate/cardiolipin synthase-like enzyme
LRTNMVVVVLAAFLVVGVAAGAYFESVAMGQAPTVTSTVSVTTTSTVTTTSQSGISSYSVCFSPGGNCASQILAVIASANSSIHMIIYSFTNTQIASALVLAKNRGVDVKIIMDGSEAASNNLAVEAVLNQGGVPLKIYTPANGIVHDKVAVVDGKIVITGSYNWSYSAENYNDENLLILHSTALAAQYETTFEGLWNQITVTG